MKIEVSISSSLLKRAERYAKQNNISLDKLFSRALKDYLDKRPKYTDEDITARLNEVYSKVDSSLDPVLLKMALMSLPKDDEW